MDPRVLGDLLDRDSGVEGTALHVTAGGRDRRYDHREVVTAASRAANLLRHLGVREGGRVAVAPDCLSQPVLTFLGAALVGAETGFDPLADGSARAVVVSAPLAESLDLPPVSKLVVYGDRPAEPTAIHWETEVWSENPATPPASVSPDDAVLVGERAWSHAAVLEAAQGTADAVDLRAGDAVAVRASLADPRTVVGGVVAPLLVGGTVVLPDERAAADVAVADGAAPESVAFSPESVPL